MTYQLNEGIAKSSVDSQEAINWLKSLKRAIGQPQFSSLWHYEEALDKIIKMLEQRE